MGSFDIRRAFAQRDAELHTKLDASGLSSHPTTKGDHTEEAWIALLRDFLPKRYLVDTAFVVDVNGNCSEQQDIVIFDGQYSPLLFRIGDSVFIPAESVYGVFEVKPELDKAMLEYAADKAATVRSLERTAAEIVHAGGTHDPKEPFTILAGILTSRPGWSPPFGDAFNTAVSALEGPRLLDLGCVAACGSFQVTPGSITVEEDQAMMSFLLGLLTRLQAMGTVGAIDLVRWSDAGQH